MGATNGLLIDKLLQDTRELRRNLNHRRKLVEHESRPFPGVGPEALKESIPLGVHCLVETWKESCDLASEVRSLQSGFSIVADVENRAASRQSFLDQAGLPASPPPVDHRESALLAGEESFEARELFGPVQEWKFRQRGRVRLR